MAAVSAAACLPEANGGSQVRSLTPPSLGIANKLYSPPPLVHYLVSGLPGHLQGSFNPYLGNPIPD